MEAAEEGGTACAILNGANEEAVGLFLAEKIGFYDIPDLVAAARSERPGDANIPRWRRSWQRTARPEQAVTSAIAMEIFMTIVYILAAILIFGVLIAVHELGHFLAAKLCGVRVNEFSIGMGPADLAPEEGGDGRTPPACCPSAATAPWRGRTETSGNARAFTRQGFWKKFVILAAGCFHEFPGGTC